MKKPALITAVALAIFTPLAARAQILTLPAPKPGHAIPLVVVVADSAGAETTDFIIPYAVLRESGVAEVRALSTVRGPIPLHGALTVMADQSMTEFNAARPEGADIVIVPAQMNPKSPALAAFVTAQAAKGATIVSICEGARVLAEAGLLKDKRATTHWFVMKRLEKKYPDTTWVRDRRYVQDGAVISTTGVSASIPVSLALVEAIAGRPVAQATADSLGAPDWSPAHRTADFHVSVADYLRVAWNIIAPWSHETVEIPLADGMDEVSLALRADTWGRTYRTRVVSTRPGRATIQARRGLRVIPDAEPEAGRFVIPAEAAPPAAQVDSILARLDRRYGPAAVRFATFGLEYDPPRTVAATGPVQ